MAQLIAWPEAYRHGGIKMVFNKKSAAEYCGISIETLDRFKDSGRLGFTRIGKRVVFRQIELDQFLAALTVPAKTVPTLREQQVAAAADRRRLREAVQGVEG
jgi:excisionase family DNA binding protein